MGITFTSASIQLAEGAIANGEDAIAQEAGELYREKSGDNPTISAEADVYQKMSSLSRIYGSLLRADNTGITLMEYIAAQPQEIPYYMLRDVFAIGVKFSADAYKVVYRA